ncbi:hypothetical protein COCNU_16G008490 [Cocos nucifera]|uniref:Uncharacterized protein n=1 Tax=Cocos nucifera TaxID=13894 RepID=A0A8K0IYX4_COCNU|nr:hypothetical protein COCNU_16G008490 [Cocos nucifera]
MVGEAVVALAAPAPAQYTSALAPMPDMLVGVLPVVEEQNDDVVVVDAPTTPIELVISWAPSMPESAYQWQEKALASTATSKTPSGSVESINISIPINEFALMNLVLPKLLVKAILLSTDKQHQKSRTIAKMFSSFYTFLIGVAHDVSALERVMHNFMDICQGWCDKAKKVTVERNAAIQHLQATSDKMKEMEEKEKKFEEKNSQHEEENS